MRLPGKLWFRDSCSGISWQHRLVDFQTLCRLSDGVECHALTHEGHRAVYYLRDEPLDALKHLYLHELRHRIALAPGAIDHLWSIHGAKTAEEYAEREERSASFYAGPMAEACSQFLRLPRPPK